MAAIKKNNNNVRIALILALGLFVFLVVSLSNSIATYSPPQSVSSTVTRAPPVLVATTNQAPLIVGNANPAFALNSLIVETLVLIAIICIVFYIFARKKRRNLEEQDGSILGQILGALVAVGLLLFLVSIARAAIGGLTFFAQFAYLVLIIVGEVIGLVVLNGKFDLLAPFRRRPNDHRAGKKPVTSTNQENVEEFKDILLRTTISLDERTKGFRDVIVDCYKQTLLFLERGGIMQDESLTAREFEQEIASKIGIEPSKYLHALTLVFERARYSNEELSSGEVDEALSCLKGLGDELSVTALQPAL